MDHVRTLPMAILILAMTIPAQASTPSTGSGAAVSFSEKSKEFKAARAAAIAFCKKDEKRCSGSVDYLVRPIDKEYCEGSLKVDKNDGTLSIQCNAGGTMVKLTRKGKEWQVLSVEYVPGGE